MSRAVFTVNFNRALCDNSRASLQASARRWGADFVEVSEGSGKLWQFPIAPNALKCAVFDRTSYNEVFILDADVIVSSRCPNPFETFTNPCDLVAVQNGSKRFGDYALVKRAEEYEIRKLVAADGRFANYTHHVDTYFNSGMMLARRAYHEEMFRLALEVCHIDHGLGWVDQTPLNLARWKCHVPMTFASERWNYIHGSTLGEGWMNMLNKDVYIYHFAGETGREHVMPKIIWQ
jgi:lipopolysaccharide biosynthesis glycosyltransferase